MYFTTESTENTVKFPFTKGGLFKNCLFPKGGYGDFTNGHELHPLWLSYLKVVTPVKTGVQMVCNCLKGLDSSLRRNDGKRKPFLIP